MQNRVSVSVAVSVPLETVNFKSIWPPIPGVNVGSGIVGSLKVPLPVVVHKISPPVAVTPVTVNGTPTVANAEGGSIIAMGVSVCAMLLNPLSDISNAVISINFKLNFSENGLQDRFPGILIEWE